MEVVIYGETTAILSVLSKEYVLLRAKMHMHLLLVQFALSSPPFEICMTTSAYRESACREVTGTDRIINQSAELNSRPLNIVVHAGLR